MASLKSISFWAANHPKIAITLIVMIEIFNFLIGIIVGSEWWGTLPTGVLFVVIGGVIMLRFLWNQYSLLETSTQIKAHRYRWEKQSLGVMFCLNLIAYCIAGGLLERMSASPTPTATLHASQYTHSVTSESNSLPKAKRPLLHFKQKESSSTGRRIGSFVLFVVGVALAYVGALLACNLACSSYGFGAVIVGLLSIGILAGGFYFLGRGLSKTLIPFKDMTPEQRKRERRRYLRTLGGTALGIALWLLLVSFN